MKKYGLLLACLIFTLCAFTQTSWYEGGTLHKKTLSEWNRASDRNKLATCADFVATSTKTIDRRKSENLKSCINEVAKEPKVRHLSVSSIAAACMIEMGY